MKTKINLKWFQAAAVRAIKTAAQTALSMITVGQAFFEINWVNVLSVSGVSAIYSLITSLAGLPEVPEEDETQNK